MEKIDDNLAELLNNIFGWSQTIRLTTKSDGVDDTALIIQEMIEDYVVDNYNIKPSDVINYEKYNIKCSRYK